MVEYRLDHTSIYTSDLLRAKEAYQTLGLDTMLDMYNKDNFHFIFLGNGRGYQLQLEPPFRLYDYEQRWQDKHGFTFNHVCFFVNKCAEGEQQFKDKDVEVIFPTSTVLFVDSAVGVDDEGINLELLAYNGDIRFGDMDRTKALKPHELSLQQLSFSTKNPEAKAAYYVENFGFKIIEKRADGAIFITDQKYNATDNDMIIKLTPLSNRRPFFKAYDEKHGATIDHIVFVAEDPKTAWMTVVAKEKMMPFKAPEFDEREGCIALAD